MTAALSEALLRLDDDDDDAMEPFGVCLDERLGDDEGVCGEVPFARERVCIIEKDRRL